MSIINYLSTEKKKTIMTYKDSRLLVLRARSILKTSQSTRPETQFIWVVVIGAKNHKRQRRKRQSVTAKRENRKRHRS